MGTPRFKILAPCAPIKYSSTDTRSTSIQGFLGGAEFNEVHEAPKLQPGELPQDLEAKFKSGANRTDLPSGWGYPNVTRYIGPVKAQLSDELFSWRRIGGEPLYKK